MYNTGHLWANMARPVSRMICFSLAILYYMFDPASKPAKTKKPRGSKSSKTAAKVALMKMKLKAEGDSTPEEEKVYLQVLLPRGSTTTSKPLYFSKVRGISILFDS